MQANITKFVGVWAIATLIFLSGFWLSSWIADKKINQIQQSIERVALDAESIEIERLLALEKPCDLTTFEILTNSLDSMTKKWATMAEEGNVVEKELIKKKYFLEELRHWHLVRQLNEQCNLSYQTILYFYSKNCPTCEAQGIVLSAEKEKLRKNGKELMIYSFDVDLDFAPIILLKAKYKITETPAIVIDGKPYLGFVSDKDLDQLLAQNTSKGKEI
ncbi:MAG: glutaredoxin family protein [Candidatus Nanoarchaeia archaeon]